MIVRVVKPFGHALRIFPIGEIGEVVEVAEPFIFRGKPLYDHYVKFPNYQPIGVLKHEVEEVPNE